jgi:hypothetical protein
MKNVLPLPNDLPAGMEEADRLLRERFPAPFRNSYLGGKTIFRDFFYENLGCSLLEAEEWVDTLERLGRIKFQPDPGKGGLGTWEIL